MKTKNQIIVLLLGFLISGYTYAQNKSITGSVADSQSALPGATVLIKGTSHGTSTDFTGNFTLKNISAVNKQLELEVSFLGYETQTIPVTFPETGNLNIGTIRLSPVSSQLNEVVVSSMGQRNSEARALNIQKKAINISNVIAADGIGKLPDRNAAEAVQRIQGISIERDQGEGRFVSVRGLPPFWSSTTINGNRIPTAEEETTSRSTAFDFFPSDLIGYVQASKAVTPDMDADAIGGSVNFVTQTAPVKKTLNISFFSGLNQKADKGVYNGAITFGNKTKDGKFGYILNATHWNRNWATDNYEARRSGDKGVYRLELRDYTGVRKTTGFNGAFEFNPSQRSKFYVKTIYGTLADEETHYKHRIRFDKFNNATNTIRVEQQNIHNELITQFLGSTIGGKHEFNKGTLDWDISSYENTFKYGDIPDQTNNSYYLVQFNQNGVGINPNYVNNIPVQNGGAGGYRAYWAADGGLMDPKNPKTIFNFFSDSNFKTDPSKMKFAGLELYKVDITERDNIVAAANYEYVANDKLTLKLGGKFLDKDRRAKFRDEYYVWNGAGTGPLLSDFGQHLINQPGGTDYLNELDTPIGNSFGPVLSTDGMDYLYNSTRNNLKISEADSQLPELGTGLGRNFNVDETHISGYGMGTYKISEKLTVLGGVRLTDTKTKVSGKTLNDGNLIDTEETKKYLSVLPMLHIKYSPNNNLNLRFATTRTFARPNYGDITPGGSLNTLDNEFAGGNPKLNPTYSWNYDLLGEYYFDNVGVVNAGVFYKSLKDPVFDDTFQGTVNGVSGVEISAPNNGDKAWIGGFEAGINKRFDFLPGFLKYFGTQLNATFMDSQMTLAKNANNPEGRKVNIPYQAKQIYNAQLYFERAGFNTRLAFNHKGAYAIGYDAEAVNTDTNDVYYGEYNTLDFSASIKITKYLTIFTDVNNILNKPLMYHYGSDTSRPKQVEYYGLKGNLGIKFNL